MFRCWLLGIACGSLAAWAVVEPDTLLEVSISNEPEVCRYLVTVIGHSPESVPAEGGDYAFAVQTFLDPSFRVSFYGRTGTRYRILTAPEITGPWTLLPVVFFGTNRVEALHYPLDNGARYFRLREQTP